jgi:hypothetical protein
MAATTLVGLGVLSACGGEFSAERPLRQWSSPEPPASPEPHRDDDSQNPDEALYLAEEILNAVEQPLHLQQQLNAARFMVRGLTASLLDLSSSKIPFVSFEPVDGADHYQILRCHSEAKLDAEGMDLREVMAQEQDLSSWLERLRSGSFWETLEQGSSCLMIQSSLARTSFLDTEAQEGRFQYIVRACVLAEPSSDLQEEGSRCSRLLALSPSVAAHPSGKTDDQSSTRQQVTTLRAKLDQASLQLASATRDFARHMVLCEREHRKETLARHQKDLLLAVLGLGARLGAEVLSAGGSNPLVGLRSVWKDHELLRRESRPVIEVLKDVFETEAHVLKQCASAHEQATKARSFLVKVTEQSRLLLDLVATLKTGAREVLK